MQYAKVQDGQVVQVGLPTTGTLKDGSTVSGYNLLAPAILAQEGWLPLDETAPEYDAETQYLQSNGYIVQADKVIIDYVVLDIPVPEPTPQVPTLEEQITELQAQNAQMLLALVMGGLM